MEKIASFTVDHCVMEPGIYISRQDGDILTFDIRMLKPNTTYLQPSSAHTIEHLGATYLRNNEEFKDKIIYFGPMGCLTGFYLVTKFITETEAIKLIKSMFVFISEYEGAIPGCSKIECGNYLMHDLQTAKLNAETFVKETLSKMSSKLSQYKKP